MSLIYSLLSQCKVKHVSEINIILMNEIYHRLLFKINSLYYQAYTVLVILVEYFALQLWEIYHLMK